MRQSATSLLLACVVTATMPVAAWAHPLDLPLNDKQLSPAELAIHRYKRQRLSLRLEGATWQVVQGINVTVPDEQLLQLAGLTERAREQKQRELIGGAMAVVGGLAGIFGVLTLTQVVPVPEGPRMGVGLGSIAGGILLAGAGELFFPVMLPGDHFLSVDEARTAIEIVNERLRADLGVPPEAAHL